MKSPYHINKHRKGSTTQISLGTYGLNIVLMSRECQVADLLFPKQRVLRASLNLYLRRVTVISSGENNLDFLSAVFICCIKKWVTFEGVSLLPKNFRRIKCKYMNKPKIWSHWCKMNYYFLYGSAFCWTRSEIRS